MKSKLLGAVAVFAFVATGLAAPAHDLRLPARLPALKTVAAG